MATPLLKPTFVLSALLVMKIQQKKSTTKKYAKQIPKTDERDDRQAVPGLVEQFEQKRLIEATLLLPLLLLLLLLLVLAAVVRFRRFDPNTAEENIDQF